jgi:hypothetical protein
MGGNQWEGAAYSPYNPNQGSSPQQGGLAPGLADMRANVFRPPRGLGATARVGSATFTGDPGRGGAGMSTPGAQPPTPPQGSSYTLGAGMGGTSRYAGMNLAGGTSKMAQQLGSNPNLAVSPFAGADIGQNAPRMSIEEMQDPANAAMAGFSFAATQDQAPSASTNGPGRLQPQPQQPQPAPVPATSRRMIAGPVSPTAANAAAATQPKQPLNIPRVPGLQR